MTKRISSLFTLSRDGRPQTPDPHPTDSPQYPHSPDYASPSGNKLHKHRFTASSDVDFANDISPLQPPPFLTDTVPQPPSSGQRYGPDSRTASRDTSPHSQAGSVSRPQTPNLLIPGVSSASPARSPTPTSAKVTKKKSWLPGRSDKHKFPDGPTTTQAWIAGLKDHVPYDLTALLNGEQVSELWNESGDTVIYLFPPSSGKGPSFRVDSALLLDSRALINLRAQSPAAPVFTNSDLPQVQTAFSNLSIDPQRSRPSSQQSSTYRPSMNFSIPNIVTSVGEEKHVYLPLGFDANLYHAGVPITGDDFELVVLYRNFFAFLAGGALVATPRQVTLFSIFTCISSLLRRFCFSNVDGSTFGHIPATSFAGYCDELKLADIRGSREKTIEAIVLGEIMRSWQLYNEGFTHAVGRLPDIKSIKSPKYEKLSPVTINRLERASLDIEQRLMTLRTKLDDFDFPSMFAGIANSQSSTEAKLVRFKEWKVGFLDFRRFIISHYRRRYGAWPPKASSKKNKFEESGLNRVLLREVYKDFTDMYDTLVDRTSLTPRTADMPPMEEDAESQDMNESIQHAIRRVESEYDRATPPVMPPIPFDTPLVPQFAHSFNRTHVVVSDHTAMQSKKLSSSEVNEVLLGSYNRDNINASAFIQDFFNHERRLGQGKTLDQIVDARCGQWLFMYAVLQSLPMTVVDARDLNFTELVEYFLCVGPRGGKPWMREDHSTSRAWYNVSSGGGIVNLPADQIDHSVEGIYRRSHCWTVANKWVGATKSPALPPLQSAESLPSPHLSGANSNPPYLASHHSPYSSPQLSPRFLPASTSLEAPALPSLAKIRSHLELGLEAVSEPPPQATLKPAASFNPNITFDDILGGTTESNSKGKKSKKYVRTV